MFCPDQLPPAWQGNSGSEATLRHQAMVANRQAAANPTASSYSSPCTQALKREPKRFHAALCGYVKSYGRWGPYLAGDRG